jgi:hypothetical protein
MQVFRGGEDEMGMGCQFGFLSYVIEGGSVYIYSVSVKIRLIVRRKAADFHVSRVPGEE